MTIKNFRKMTRAELMERYSLTEEDKYLLDELEAVEEEVSQIIAKEGEK